MTKQDERWVRIRNKVTEKQAIRFDGDNFADIYRVTGSAAAIHPIHERPVIHTLEGDHLVSVGDWVIRGLAGEFYPCKPDIFEKSYEVVSEGSVVAEQPVPSGNQSEREREEVQFQLDLDYWRKYGKSDAWLIVTVLDRVFSLLDAERKRVQELEGALRVALQQWRIHAEDDPDFDNDNDITPEGRLYRKINEIYQNAALLPKEQTK